MENHKIRKKHFNFEIGPHMLCADFDADCSKSAGGVANKFEHKHLQKCFSGSNRCGSYGWICSDTQNRGKRLIIQVLWSKT